MDFDHREGEVKVFTIGESGTKRITVQALLREIAKCDVVCACCHRLRTDARIVRTGVSRWVRRRRELRALIDRLKEANPCAKCGRRFKGFQMDLHHVGPKTTSVSHLVAKRAREEVILAEVAKCIAICVNCHRLEGDHHA